MVPRGERKGMEYMEHTEKLELLESILNAYPYPIVFVGNDYKIRFMNRNAEYHYYQERGYSDLIGASIFECHNNEKSVERIKTAYEGIKRNGKEVFIGVSTRNLRIYIQGVRNSKGEWIGFFERFELNQQL